MIPIFIAKDLARINGFESKIDGDRFIYWNETDTFSTLITDNEISMFPFRKNISKDNRP